jgi:hypothetical protein
VRFLAAGFAVRFLAVFFGAAFRAGFFTGLAALLDFAAFRSSLALMRYGLNASSRAVLYSMPSSSTRFGVILTMLSVS